MLERRLKWLAWLVIAWGAGIFYRLVSLQVVHHPEYVLRARNREELKIEIPAPRGTLFDRNGQVLAMSAPTESIFVNPKKVPDLGLAAEILSAELHLNRPELYGEMKLALANKRGFMWVDRKVDFEVGRHLASLNLEWIGVERESRRHYPNGTLAAHLLGGVDFQERGNAGIEKSLENDLRGQPGQMRMLTDVKRRGIDSQLTSEARSGAPVTLTLDSRLQYLAERELAAAVQAHNAVSGSVVMMNPYTGDILVMASYPTYDPNQPPVPGERAAGRMNHAVSVPFEPGSVFKVITLSAALETTRLRPESLIDCHGGVLKLPGRVIHDSHLGLGVLPMAEVLARSSNIGAIEVGLTVGQQNMYDYARRFGFGQKTGIALPGESGGKLRKLAHWGTTSLASIAMGQEVSVTTVQLAQAGAVVANGGLLVRPRLVLRKGGEIVPPTPPVRVIQAETALTMRQMMEGVVLHGTGTNARIPGYTVGGKTGSAQIFDFATRHYTHTYNGSFLGFAPLNNPAIVVAVTINGTHGTAGFGGQAAAPVFRAVAAEALRVMDVPKDLPDEMATANAPAEVSDLADADTSAGRNILEEGDEEDTQTAQVRGAPKPAAPVVAPTVPAAAPPPAKPAAPPEPRVPDFAGMTMRAVLSQATALGIDVVPYGSGTAQTQSPAAGTVLRQGERIRVRFSR